MPRNIVDSETLFDSSFDRALAGPHRKQRRGFLAGLRNCLGKNIVEKHSFGKKNRTRLFRR